jgi:hypothetical protein
VDTVLIIRVLYKNGVSGLREYLSIVAGKFTVLEMDIRGPFEKFVEWRQCAAVMQREAVTFMPSCSGGGNVVVT